MLFALCIVSTAIPFSGAVQDQNIQKTNGNNVNEDFNPGITGAETHLVKTLLQDNKPFGASTDEILGNNTTPQEIKLGANGDQVKEVQQWLYDYGYYTGAIDGVFGNDTDQALITFQEEAGILVDGLAGEETKKAMEHWDEYLAQAQKAIGESQTSVSPSSRSRSSRTYAASAVRTSYRGGAYTSGKGVGDCWANSDNLYGQLTSSGQKARILQYASSMSSRHRSVQVYSNGAWVNYDYKANGYSWGYYATSGSSSGNVIKSS